MDMSFRFLYLIFDRLLGWLMLLGRALSKDVKLVGARNHAHSPDLLLRHQPAIGMIRRWRYS